MSEPTTPKPASRGKRPPRRRSSLAGKSAVQPTAPLTAATDPAEPTREQSPTPTPQAETSDAATAVAGTSKSTAAKAAATDPAATKTAKKAPVDVNRTGEMVEVGLYWADTLRDQARAAYVSDYHRLGAEAPAGFDRWVEAAVERHSALSTSKRSKEVAALPEPPEGTKRSTKVRLEAATVERLDEEIITDEMAGIYRTGRGPAVLEAVRVAIEEARTRAGGTLPPAPRGRLPIRPRTTR